MLWEPKEQIKPYSDSPDYFLDKQLEKSKGRIRPQIVCKDCYDLGGWFVTRMFGASCRIWVPCNCRARKEQPEKGGNK